MQPRKSTHSTLTDRVALFVGAGIVGGLTGAMLWLPLSFLALQFGTVLPFSWFSLSFGFGAALGAVVAPDRTADFIAKAWHGVVNLWRAVSGV